MYYNYTWYTLTSNKLLLALIIEKNKAMYYVIPIFSP